VITLANDSLHWVGSDWVLFCPLVVGWVGLGQSVDGLGWIETRKMDPWTSQRGSLGEQCCTAQ